MANKQKIKIFLINDVVITGDVIISDIYYRFSDFIEKSEDKHLKMFDVSVKGKTLDFLMVPKSKILYYEILE